MKIKQAEFVISAIKPEQYPKSGLPEIAFVGRSNVGKSSLINTLTNIRKLAKVSSTPGKTRLVNFFLINKNMYFVDLPGYGYAKVSKGEKSGWKEIIEGYLTGSKHLKKVVMLIDSRREPSEDDILMYNWIKYYKYKILIAATKVDKLTKNEIAKSTDIIREKLNLGAEERILYLSSLKKIGVEALVNEIFKELT